MTTSVSDARSNPNDQLAHAANVLKGAPQRLAVFHAIYSGKRRIKSVDDLAGATGLTRKQVLQQGLILANNHIVSQTTKDAQTAYEKDPFYSSSRAKIERLAMDPAKLEALPTKTRPQTAATGSTVIRVPRAFYDVTQLHVDDIDSFSAVRGVKVKNYRPMPLTEKAFKDGMQALLHEPGVFKDWGGEANDLWTTRVTIGGRRLATAMAFKGKGMTGKLTPRKMGKNGDQIQRLYQVPADLYVLQYWAQIDQSVFTLMHSLAVSRSAMNGGKLVRYLVIDGEDSQRLILAYPKRFPGGAT